MHVRAARGAIAAAMLLCCGLASAGAQTIRGTVRDSASGLTISGAVVLLVGRSGSVLESTLTETDGTYALGDSATAAWLRVLHIGFRPHTVPLPASRSGQTVMDLTLASLPTMLDTMFVVRNSDCPKRSDAAVALALLDHVRDGVLATEVASRARPSIVTRVLYKRFRDDHDDILDQSMRTIVEQSTRSFTAVLNAGDFVKSGFVRDSAGVAEFFAPDAGTVVDAAFAGGYCFELASSRKRPRQVGLRFTPGRHQPRNIVAITGTLWTDTASRTLKDLEFKYLNLDRATERMEPGGTVSFQALSNGIVLVHRWSLRLPAGRIGSIAKRRPSSSFFVQESGGRVASARWADGFVWNAPLGSLRLHAANGSGQPVQGAPVRIPESSDSASSDRDGDVVLPYLIAGPWQVTALDPGFLDLGLEPPVVRKLNVHSGEAISDTVVLRPPRDLVISTYCTAPPRGDTNGILVGRLLSPSGVPVARDTVAAQWYRHADFGMQPQHALVISNDLGVFTFCGLPTGVRMAVFAADSVNGFARDTIEVSWVSPLLRHDLWMVRPGGGARTSSPPGRRAARGTPRTPGRVRLPARARW